MNFVFKKEDWVADLKKDIFLNGMEHLSDAFRIELSEKTMEVYWIYLHPEFTNNFYRHIVTEIIQNELTFPSIAIFFKYVSHSRIDKHGNSRPQI